MQWNSSINAGFNMGAKTWLKINDNYKTINVEDEKNDSNSILNFYKKVLRLRKNSQYENTFVYGKFINILKDDERIFAYIRQADKKVLVIANMVAEEVNINLSFKIKEILLTNYQKKIINNLADYKLSPFESLVIEIY